MDECNNTSYTIEVIGKNPVAVLLLGACPAMALTTDIRAALAIGLTAMVIMLLSSAVMTGLSKMLSKGARLAACLIVTTFFVSAAELLMNAYLPKVYSMMGIYLAVFAVNLMIFAAGENACHLSFGKAVVNALLMGLCFTAVVLVVAAVRELFGSGSFAGHQIEFFKNHTVSLLSQAPGGLMIYAFAAAVVNALCPKTLVGEGMALAAVGLDKEDAE